MAEAINPLEIPGSLLPGTRLTGVAVEVPEPFRTTLYNMRVACGDPMAALIPPHVTLLPPTRVTEEEWQEVASHLASAAADHRQFDMELRGMDTFRPVSPVVFARVVSGGEECIALQAAVRSGPLAITLPFEYHPHVTVAQNLPDPVLDRAMQQYADLHVTFPIRSFEHYAWSDNDWALQGVYELAPRT